MRKFVFLDTHSTPKTDFGIIQKILGENDIEFIGQKVMEEDDVIACCADADGIALTYPMINANVIDHLNKCKVIIRNGIGYDNVDIPVATQKGIAVCNIPEFCTEEVAAHALALMMDAQRKTTLLDRQARNGQWDATYGYRVRRLSSLTVGLLSFGKTAQKLSQYCNGLEMNVICYDPFVPSAVLKEKNVRGVALDELFVLSDIISIHSPLLPVTKHLIRRENIEKMKDGVIIVNTSRGPIVCLEDLVEALKSGKVAAAGLDVFEGEPILDMSNDIYTCETMIITPHAAYYSKDSAIDQITNVANTAVKVLNGEMPDNVLNRKELAPRM